MSTRSNVVSLVSVAAFALGACTGTDTGNPYTQPITVDARTSNSTEVSIQVGDGGAIVTEIWLSIDELGLTAADDCGATPTVLTPKVGVADHAEDEALRISAQVPQEAYCRVTIPWSLAANTSGAPSAVVGTSAYLAGQSPLGTPFVLRSTFVGAVEAPAISGSFELAPDLGGVFLGFDLATWFAGIDLDSATIGGGGTIVIDATNNASLLNAFDDNLAAGLELYRDANENGQIDGAEDALLARGAQ